MSTYMAKKETLERKWYVIDAANKPLGKTAVAAANLVFAVAGNRFVVFRFEFFF